jgi:DNA-binding MarR family transcriptional regulator
VPEVSPYEVGQTYLQLHKRLHRVVEEAMTASGLSLSRTKVLMELAADGPMNQSALAARLGFAPRSVTDTVDSLTRDGLAERTSNPADRRAWLVAITPTGAEALERAQAAKHVIFDQIFGALDAPARATLVSLLTTIDRGLTAGSGESCVQQHD